MSFPLLACGPYLSLDQTSFWASIVVFLVLKPVAYFGFIQAFRYRVSRPIPMSFGRAAKLALFRAGLGVVLVGVGAAVLLTTQSESLLAWSWVYLYAGRGAAWFTVGWWGAVLRGRRLVGWIVSGTMLNAAFDFAAILGLLGEWMFLTLTLIAMVAFIAPLHAIGRRAALRSRFASMAVCASCSYDLTGNLSGRCPECSSPIAVAA